MATKNANDRLIVVKHKPGIKRKRRLVFVTGVIVMSALSFLLGNYQIRQQHQKVLDQLDKLASEYALLQQSETQLRQQVFNLESGRNIDNVAKQGIQETIKEYKATIDQLKKDVSFYQSIMAPSENIKGLQVQNLELQKTSDDKRYTYKIVLAQVADNKNYISGLVAVNVVGMQSGVKEILPLRDVSEDQSSLGIKFKFKYFQDITGELILPQGFSPESIQVVAQADGKKASKLERTYMWNDLVR
jgi:cell division protein FtsB